MIFKSLKRTHTHTQIKPDLTSVLLRSQVHDLIYSPPCLLHSSLQASSNFWTFQKSQKHFVKRPEVKQKKRNLKLRNTNFHGKPRHKKFQLQGAQALKSRSSHRIFTPAHHLWLNITGNQKCPSSFNFLGTASSISNFLHEKHMNMVWVSNHCMIEESHCISMNIVPILCTNLATECEDYERDCSQS